MNINAILDDCFEDQIRAEFGILMQSLIQGDIEGADKRFESGVALAKQARDIAASVLITPSVAEHISKAIINLSGKLKPC